jgi:hypothetical protein
MDRIPPAGYSTKRESDFSPRTLRSQQRLPVESRPPKNKLRTSTKSASDWRPGRVAYWPRNPVRAFRLSRQTLLRQRAAIGHRGPCSCPPVYHGRRAQLQFQNGLGMFLPSVAGPRLRHFVATFASEEERWQLGWMSAPAGTGLHSSTTFWAIWREDDAIRLRVAILSVSLANVVRFRPPVFDKRDVVDTVSVAIPALRHTPSRRTFYQTEKRLVESGGMKPAMAAGLTDKPWTIREMLERSGAC